VEQNAALNNRLRCFPDHSQLPSHPRVLMWTTTGTLIELGPSNYHIWMARLAFVGSLRTLAAAMPDLMDALVD
jgi:hypothetical protein